MKRTTTTNLMLATAALLVASTAASAQTLKASIPFGFQAYTKAMPPGTYEVSRVFGGAVFLLRNIEAGKSVVLAAGAGHDAPITWVHTGLPTLGFSCGESGCVLRQIWTGKSAAAYEFQTPKNYDDRPTRLATIRMAAGKAD
jgi:hypothetical protein